MEIAFLEVHVNTTCMGLKLNSLNGECEQGGFPCRFPIQTIQFLAPVQFEAFPIYI